MLGDAFPDQSGIDQLVEGELMANNRDTKQSNQAKTKLAEAQQILRDLGLPRAQQNDRSALTLLALLDMKPADSWPAALARHHADDDVLQRTLRQGVRAQ